LSKNYADKEYEGGITFGDLAKSALFEIKNLSVGKIAPDIAGEDLDGAPFKLSDYRGKVVMLSFWATWCGPCMGMVPHERDLVEQYQGRPFVLIGVNGDPDRENVRPVLEKEAITWRSFWCGEQGPLGPIPRSWNVMAWPTVYIIDHTGVIRGKSLHDALIEKFVAEAESATEVGRRVDPERR
jgi:thiol-disulfide isomerase/thioredoxin